MVLTGGRSFSTDILPGLVLHPDVHLRKFREVWADEVIIEDVWRKFMQNESRWRIRSVCELRLRKPQNMSPSDLQTRQSTVMLATNVGLYRYSSIVQPPQILGGSKLPVQIASSISLFLALGSITTGLLLIRRQSHDGRLTRCCKSSALALSSFHF